MSINPDELVVALRLADRDFKKSIKEAREDLKTLKREMEEADVSRRSARVEGGLAGVRQDYQAVALAKAQEKHWKTRLKQLADAKKEVNKQLKLLVKQREEIKKLVVRQRTSLKVLQEQTNAMKMNEKVQKRINAQVEKQVKKEEKLRKLKGKGTKDDHRGIRDQTRLYGVLSSRGARMIATTRGMGGAVLMFLASAAQTIGAIIARGVQQLREYEKLALRMAVIQFGAGAGGEGGIPGLTAGGMEGWAFGDKRQRFARYGIPPLTGATMELLNLQSGLNFTEEQLIDIGSAAQMAGEDASDFMQNLIQWIYMFNIEAEDFSDTIAMFGMMGARTMGGTGQLLSSMDYIAKVATSAGWDPNEMMAVQERLKKEGIDTAKFWRAYSNVIQKVIEDDSQLAESIRGVDGELRSFEEVIWILDQTMDNFGSETEAMTWAMAEYGDEGYRAIEAMRELIDDEHEYSQVLRDAADLQKEANAALTSTKEFLEEESLNVAMTELQAAVEGVVNKFVYALSPAIIAVADGLTNAFQAVEALIPEKEEVVDAATSMGETLSEAREDIPTVPDWEPGEDIQAGYAGPATGGSPAGELGGASAAELILWLLAGAPSDWGEREEEGWVAPSAEGECPEGYELNPQSGMCQPIPTSGGRGMPNCGEGYYWDGQRCVERDPEDPGEQGDAIPESPPTFRSTRTIVREQSSKTQVVNHNYITVMDNDAVIRGLIGVNLNV